MKSQSSKYKRAKTPPLPIVATPLLRQIVRLVAARLLDSNAGGAQTTGEKAGEETMGVPVDPAICSSDL